MLAATLGLALPSQAEIAGESEPAYRVALDLWLSGDDAAALPAFSALALDGNTAAQVFLGALEPNSELYRRVTDPMDRKARIALMRKEGGLSGKSWLTVAAESEPVARLILDLRDFEKGGAAAEAALEAGLIRPLIGALLSLLNRADYTNLPLMLDERLKPFLGPMVEGQVLGLSEGYIVQGARNVPSKEGLIELVRMMRAPPAITPGDRYLWRPFAEGGRVPEDPKVLAAMARNIAATPQMEPFAAVCASVCPGAEADCVYEIAIGNMAVAGATFLPALSPVEPLVTSQEYAAAPRFRDDVLRTLSARPKPYWQAGPARECLAAAIAGVE